MKEITDSRELQLIEVETLEKVATFCEERGIRYSLGYGTLLGAIREKGFIPWDEDIDIVMPRPDYERFCKEFCVEGLSISGRENPCISVCDDRTGMTIEGKETGHGLCIDVEPIDVFPNMKGVYKAVSVIKRGKFFARLFAFKENYKWLKPGRKFYKTPVVWACKCILAIVPLRFLNNTFYLKRRFHYLVRIEKFIARYGYEKCSLAGCICTPYGATGFVAKECFETFSDVEFEGRQYKAVADYDTWLKSIYGDYMTPRKKYPDRTTFVRGGYWK